MDVLIHAVGRARRTAEADLVARYLDRARKTGPAIGLTGFAVKEWDEARGQTATVRKSKEAEMLLSACPANGALIALDEGGKALTSQTFADLVASLRDDGRPAMVFALGGPDGHGGALLERATHALSLGPMTLPHLLARVVLSEQLYRAITILTGHPYHRA